MEKVILKSHFDRPGVQKPTELEALGMYKAARAAFEQFAHASGENIMDKEISNVYAEMCRKKISGFVRGFDHLMQTANGTFHGRLESHKYSAYYSGATYGDVEITVQGPDELVNIVQKAWNKGEKTDRDKLDPIIGPYFEGKQLCYGFCRDD